MGRRIKQVVATVVVVMVAIGAILASKVSIDYCNDHEGVYLLRGVGGKWLSLTDDLFPENSERLIWGMALPTMKRAKISGSCSTLDRPCTSFEWNEESGRGFIKTTYPDGRKLLINLARFLDSSGKTTSGLFLGGGLPTSDPDYMTFNKNETGMAYFDGKRYYHIWCNVNEGILDGANQSVYPSSWKFITSKILENSATDLTLFSSHKVMVNNVPVRVDRYLFYQTGDRFVTLKTFFTNEGAIPTNIAYVYGDEPWLGNFGSSVGNIGWVRDRLITTEGNIDTERYNYAGMFDYGNELAGEKHSYTGKANFIEWDLSSRPSIAYFSNHIGTYSVPESKIPLSSRNNRVIFLQWNHTLLVPGDSKSFTIAVGMADNDPKTGMPVKPDTRLY